MTQPMRLPTVGTSYRAVAARNGWDCLSVCLEPSKPILWAPTVMRNCQDLNCA